MLGGCCRGRSGRWATSPVSSRKDLLVYASDLQLTTWCQRSRGGAGPREAADARVLESAGRRGRHFVPLAEVVWVGAAGSYVGCTAAAPTLPHRGAAVGESTAAAAGHRVRAHPPFSPGAAPKARRGGGRVQADPRPPPCGCRDGRRTGGRPAAPCAPRARIDARTAGPEVGRAARPGTPPRDGPAGSVG